MNQSPSNLDTFILIFKYVVLLLVVSCSVLAFMVAQNEKEFLIAILGVFCLVIVSFPMLIGSKVELFEPLTFLIVLVIIGIPIKIIYVLWIRRTDQFVIDHVLLNQQPDVFLPGTIVLVITLFLLMMGYSLRFPTAPLSFLYFPQVKEFNGRKLQVALFVFVIIAVSGFLAFVGSAGVSLSSLTSLSQKRFLDFRAEGGERMHNILYVFVRMAGFSKFVVYFGLIWIIHRKKSFFSYTGLFIACLLYTSPSPRDQRGSRMPSSA